MFFVIEVRRGGAPAGRPLCGLGGDAIPFLSGFVFFDGIFLGVFDGAENVLVVIEETRPLVASPRGGESSVLIRSIRERMQIAIDEFRRRGAFEQVGDVLDGILHAHDDQMHMRGEDGAGVKDAAAVRSIFEKSHADGAALLCGEADGIANQRCFGGEAKFSIVLIAGE